MSAEHESMAEDRSSRLLRTLRTLEKRKEIGLATGRAGSYSDELLVANEAFGIIFVEAETTDVPLISLERLSAISTSQTQSVVEQ